MYPQHLARHTQSRHANSPQADTHYTPASCSSSSKCTTHYYTRLISETRTPTGARQAREVTNPRHAAHSTIHIHTSIHLVVSNYLWCNSCSSESANIRLWVSLILSSVWKMINLVLPLTTRGTIFQKLAKGHTWKLTCNNKNKIVTRIEYKTQEKMELRKFLMWEDEK